MTILPTGLPTFLYPGIKPGDKVGLLLMNCLEWLPIYFGILKTGAWAVPLNFRFTADEIHKCMEVSEAKILIYGPEFIEAIKCVRKKAGFLKDYVFVGESVDNHNNDHLFSRIISEFSTHSPDISIADEDEAALYFTSGTTGTPKPIVLTHGNLVSACITENHHHLQTHEDNFLCIPPLYHTGAKMHWFGSLIVGAKAVILRV